MPDYLDTSAFIKLVRSEPESSALRRELAGRELLSSALLTVEGRRAARRYGDLATGRADAALTAITLVPLDQPILDAAAALDPAELRSLDALHLATVVSLGEESSVCIATTLALRAPRRLLASRSLSRTAPWSRATGRACP